MTMMMPLTLSRCTSRFCTSSVTQNELLEGELLLRCCAIISIFVLGLVQDHWIVRTLNHVPRYLNDDVVVFCASEVDVNFDEDILRRRCRRRSSMEWIGRHSFRRDRGGRLRN
jgi:hypothetical protein